MKSRQIDPKQIVEFMIVAGKLKWTKRTGWLREKMPQPETVAEHTYRVAILCLVLAPYLNLNRDKLVAMAIVHDIAESKFGDLVTQRGKKTIGEHKVKTENKFVRKTFTKLGLPDLSDYWEEYMLKSGLKKTRYSDVLFQIDRLANAWQVYEYELKGMSRKKTQEFWQNAQKNIKDPFLKKILFSLKVVKT